MTEQHYPLHLRKIGEPVIAQFLEDLMQEIDTHEKMFLELCHVKRERDALEGIIRGRCNLIENLVVSKDIARVALKLVEGYLNKCPGECIIADYDAEGVYKLLFGSDCNTTMIGEVKVEGFD